MIGFIWFLMTFFESGASLLALGKFALGLLIDFALLALIGWLTHDNNAQSEDEEAIMEIRIEEI